MRNLLDTIEDLIKMVPERFPDREDLVEELAGLAAQYEVSASETAKSELALELKQTLDFYIGGAVVGHGGWKQKLYALLD